MFISSWMVWLISAATALRCWSVAVEPTTLSASRLDLRQQTRDVRQRRVRGAQVGLVGRHVVRHLRVGVQLGIQVDDLHRRDRVLAALRHLLAAANRLSVASMAAWSVSISCNERLLDVQIADAGSRNAADRKFHGCASECYNCDNSCRRLLSVPTYLAVAWYAD